MKHIKHWQDAVNAVLGAALILSPWVAGYDGEMVATVNAVVVGLALVATAFGAMLAPKAWEEWTEAILGLWMIMSPWLLAYSHLQMAMYVAVFGGVAVVVLALWTLATDKEFSLPKSMQP
ncbi:MAG: SPW repeat protein [Rhodoferax sp.]|nr:SPW repeat protein [Rhodoferax sp.]